MSAVCLGVVLLRACCMVCRITCQDYENIALRNNIRVEDEQLCEENVCLNGGTCYWKTNGYSCQCPTGFTGRKCHIRKAPPALRSPFGGSIVRTGEGVVVSCKGSNFTMLLVRDVYGRWNGTVPKYCPEVNPMIWNRNRTDNSSSPKENDTMNRFDSRRKNGFERHVQMVVERAMFEVMGSVDRRMQRFMAKVNQRIEFLEQKLAIVYPDILSSDEQRDVNDIDLSDVESDSEEDFDSVEMDYETALWESRNKKIRIQQEIMRKSLSQLPQEVLRNLLLYQIPQSTTESPVQHVDLSRVPPSRIQRRNYRPAWLPGRKVLNLESYRSRSKKYATQ